jgi:hypothetical protein
MTVCTPSWSGISTRMLQIGFEVTDCNGDACLVLFKFGLRQDIEITLNPRHSYEISWNRAGKRAFVHNKNHLRKRLLRKFSIGKHDDSSSDATKPPADNSERCTLLCRIGCCNTQAKQQDCGESCTDDQFHGKGIEKYQGVKKFAVPPSAVECIPSYSRLSSSW